MVANSPIERVGSGQMDYLLNRLADIERRLDQGGARSSYPFSVAHGLGVRDFSIEPSTSGDGTADIFIGDGAGGKLVQIKTSTLYGTKILQILDQQGASMFSTDAAAGYGVGTPSYAFQYAGYESNTLSGATSQATAREYARGTNWVYNPATYVQPRVRMLSATAETVKLFAQWQDAQGNLTNTSDITVNLSAGAVSVGAVLPFGHLWDANDMNFTCKVFLKAYCTSGTPANVNITGSYQDGYGISKGFYDQFSSGWAV